MKFINNLTFENFGKMDIEEFIKLLSSSNFILQGSFNNLENSLKSFMQSKIDINIANKINLNYSFIIHLSH